MRPFLLYVLPFLVAYAGTFVWVVRGWLLPDGYYSHGVLLPVLAGFAIWRVRHMLGAAGPAGATGPARLAGSALLATGLLVHVAGSALLVDSLSAASLVPSVVGLLLLAAGPARLRLLAPAVGLLLFAIPLPMFVTGNIAFRMKEAATVAATGLANLFGLGATRVGSYVYVPGQESPLVVGEPCSGLRSLVALVTLGYCFAFFVGGPGKLRRSVLVLSAIPIALGANVLRIAGLTWLARWQGVEYASTTGHDVGNWLIYGLAIGMLLLLDAKLPQGDPPAATEGGPGAGAEPAGDPATRGGGAARASGAAIALWVVAPVVCSLQFYRPPDVGGSRAAGIPADVGAWRRQRTHELTERTYALLGTRDVLWANYEDPSGGVVTLTVVFHAANWRSVHPPDVCIMGSGYSIESAGVTELAARGSDGRPVEVGTIDAAGEGGRLSSFYVFGTRGFTTPSYLSFFLHHVPAALLRSATEGFLLRVECLDGGDASGARERCARFIGDVLPVVQDVLK